LLGHERSLPAAALSIAPVQQIVNHAAPTLRRDRFLRVTAMKWPVSTLLPALLLAPVAAPAQEQGVGCGVAEGALVAQGNGQVTITCVGVTAAFGSQLAGVLTYVLQHRLDPELVIVKLGEIEGRPEGDQPRTLSAEQGQTILQSLVGQPGAQITILAHPQGSDSSDYAVAIATRLGMAGWKIEGSQIRRLIPPGLGEIDGLLLAVRDEKTPSEPAVRLKAAMAKARILLPIVSDATLPEGAMLLWVGKRPSYNTATQ
jgi:hypothetical protein